MLTNYFFYGILNVRLRETAKQTKRKGEKKMAKIYIKKTPISDWQFIGTVKQEQVNQIQARASMFGYYCKVEY